MTAMPTPGTPLTETESRVVALVAEGLTNAEIAARVWMSVDTVRTHLARISRRLGARNRAHVVVLAMETGRWWPGGVDPRRDAVVLGQVREARRRQRIAEEQRDGYRHKYLTALETIQELREGARR